MTVIIISYDYPDGTSDVSLHYVESNRVGCMNRVMDTYRKVVKEYPDRLVEIIQTSNIWSGKHDLFWGNKDPSIKTIVSTNNEKIKIEFNVLVQISDHSGYCSDNENDYSEYKEFVEYNLSNFEELIIFNDEQDELGELKRLNVEDNIPSHLFRHFNLDDLVSRVDTEVSNDGYCRVSEESKKYGLGQHDTRITILSGKLISK